MVTEVTSEISSDVKRVLVAEDDRVFAGVLCMALVRAGYQVSVAHDGKKALQEAQATRYDVIVSDYQMPGLNGRQFLTGVRSGGASRDALLVLCSAKTYELDSEQLRDQLGLTALFYKPYSLNELVTALREALLAPSV